MASKLGVWREAARLLGTNDLSTLTDDVEVRYVFDGAYDSVVQQALSLGWWRFAFQSVAASPTSSTVAPGYSHRFSVGSTVLRTHSICVTTGTVSVPVDWRDQGGFIYTKFASVTHNHTLNNATTESAWPEVFAKVVAALLAFETCERVAQNSRLKSDLAQIFQDRLGVCRETESVPPPMNLREHAVEEATRFVLEQGFWRHSVKTFAITDDTNLAASPAFTNRAAKPSDWLRTYQVCRVAGNSLIPIDWRDAGGNIHTLYASPRLQYVSTDAISPSTWTQGFRSTVDAYLALEAARAAGSSTEVESAKAQYDRVLDAALAKDGLPRPLVLREFVVDQTTRMLLEAGFWRHSMVTASLSSSSSFAEPGFNNRATKPADCLRVHTVGKYVGNTLIPTDWRDADGYIYTIGDGYSIQYVSSDAVDPANWPEGFRAAVDAFLAVEAARALGTSKEAEAAKVQYDRVLDAALAKDGWPRPMQLREGSYREATMQMLESGIWKFGRATIQPTAASGTPSKGYTYRFAHPANWVRTVRVYKPETNVNIDIDYRDEDGHIHTNHEVIVWQYISSAALDPTNWSELFTQSWFSLLRYYEARDNGLPQAEVQNRFGIWQASLREARNRDAMNERPVVNKTSVFAAARRGNMTAGREQGR